MAKIPPLYASENVPLKDKKIHEHFFLAGNDWYVAEYDPEDQLIFGYAILNGDYQNAEWGYVDYRELKDIKVHGFEIDRDLYWKPTKAGEIEKIVESGGVR